MWTWNHLQLEVLEIQRKLVYYLRYDNSGHMPFSLSGPEICCSLDCTIQQKLFSSEHQYDKVIPFNSAPKPAYVFVDNVI
jgi:hypothetical protein